MGSERLLVLLSRWRVNLATALVVPAAILARPSVRSIEQYVVLILLGVALRTWARGYLERQDYVTQAGPYARVRHPLYVGSYLIGLGFAAMCRSPLVVALYTAGFLVMYVPKAIREEQHLRRVHGPDYDQYAAVVPAILPRFTRPSLDTPASRARWAWRRVMRHREWKTWIGVVAGLGAMWLHTRINSEWLRVGLHPTARFGCVRSELQGSGRLCTGWLPCQRPLPPDFV